MKEYCSPDVEFVEFETDIFMTGSQECNEGYACPENYGNTCTGFPV